MGTCPTWSKNDRLEDNKICEDEIPSVSPFFDQLTGVAILYNTMQLCTLTENFYGCIRWSLGEGVTSRKLWHPPPKYMGLNPSSEAISRWATQEFLNILWNRNTFHTTRPISLRSILILYSHLRLGLPSGLFPFGFPTKILYQFIFLPMRATCPAHLTFLVLIILIHIIWTPSLWSCSVFRISHRFLQSIYLFVYQLVHLTHLLTSWKKIICNNVTRIVAQPAKKFHHVLGNESSLL
jgi:hypothetical protein